MIKILTLQQYYNEILILQQYSIYNVLNGHCKVLQYFINLSNSFMNILAILQDFNGIFSKYFLNITVLCGSIVQIDYLPNGKINVCYQYQG